MKKTILTWTLLTAMTATTLTGCSDAAWNKKDIALAAADHAETTATTTVSAAGADQMKDTAADDTELTAADENLPAPAKEAYEMLCAHYPEFSSIPKSQLIYTLFDLVGRNVYNFSFTLGGLPTSCNYSYTERTEEYDTLFTEPPSVQMTAPEQMATTTKMTWSTLLTNDNGDIIPEEEFDKFLEERPDLVHTSYPDESSAGFQSIPEPQEYQCNFVEEYKPYFQMEISEEQLAEAREKMKQTVEATLAENYLQLDESLDDLVNRNMKWDVCDGQLRLQLYEFTANATDKTDKSKLNCGDHMHIYDLSIPFK